LSHNPLKSLDGIQECDRIKVLWIESCNLITLGPICKFEKLEDFRFGGNNISGIGFLANNTRLKRLEFPNNNVKEINHLTNCINLENITFYNNNVTNISELSKLKHLKYFYPSGNPINEELISEFKKKSKAFISDFNR
jgi:Leucine-rich repeat (LRR) protein